MSPISTLQRLWRSVCCQFVPADNRTPAGPDFAQFVRLWPETDAPACAEAAGIWFSMAERGRRQAFERAPAYRAAMRRPPKSFDLGLYLLCEGFRARGLVPLAWAELDEAGIDAVVKLHRRVAA